MTRYITHHYYSLFLIILFTYFTGYGAVLFHHKSIVNLLLNYYLYYYLLKYCNDYHLRGVELPYTIVLMTNIIIDYYYIDYINFFFIVLCFYYVILHSHLIYYHFFYL